MERREQNTQREIRRLISQSTISLRDVSQNCYHSRLSKAKLHLKVESFSLRSALTVSGNFKGSSNQKVDRSSLAPVPKAKVMR